MMHSRHLPDDLARRAQDLLKLDLPQIWEPDAKKILNNCLKDNFIGVACSGGPDSTFCLLLAFATFPDLRNNIIVLHYNHRLRGKESEDDESFVKDLANKLGLPCLVEHSSDAQLKKDENTLREQRIQYWERVQKEENISVIIQGHHLDDVAETLLWRIPRGVSVDGLISPKPVSNIGAITIIRPLISISKNLIRQSLIKCSVPWREDVSNLDNLYLRNKMRNSVLPVWKESSDRNLLQGISLTRELLQQDSDALHFHAKLALEQCRSGDGLNLDLFDQFPIGTQRRVLIKWLIENAPNQTKSTGLKAKTSQLIHLLKKSGFSKQQLSNNCSVYKCENVLKFTFNHSIAKIPKISLPFNFSIYLQDGYFISATLLELQSDLINKINAKSVDQEAEAYLSASLLNGGLFVHSRKKGDTFKPLGSPGNKKLSDWMIDRKWSESKKTKTPIFYSCSNQVLWVPGFPPVECAKVTAVDKRVIRLTYRLSGT